MNQNISRYKVLFLSSWYPNKFMPTLGNFVQRHAEAVAKYDEVAALYVCSDAGLRNQTYHIEITESNDVYGVVVYYKKVKGNIPIISSIIKAQRYITAHKIGYGVVKNKISKIDIVHHNVVYPAGIVALFLKITKQIPYIITEHWSGYFPVNKHKYKGFIRKFLSRRIARHATLITPVSEELKKAMKNHGFQTSYKVIPNVVDVNLFSPQENNGRQRKKQILHISTLDENKNIKGILRVIEKLTKVRNDFEFQVISDEDIDSSVNYAKELGLYGKVAFFSSLKPTKEISEAMRNADFFVLFSFYENLPCVLIEALASGIPVISTRVGGVPDHISKDLGVLIKPGDEHELYNEIGKMLDNYQNYDKNILQKYAQEHFSYDKVGQQFHEEYAAILTANTKQTTSDPGHSQ